MSFWLQCGSMLHVGFALMQFCPAPPRFRCLSRCSKRRHVRTSVTIPRSSPLGDVGSSSRIGGERVSPTPQQASSRVSHILALTAAAGRFQPRCSSRRGFEAGLQKKVVGKGIRCMRIPFTASSNALPFTACIAGPRLYSISRPDPPSALSGPIKSDRLIGEFAISHGWILVVAKCCITTSSSCLQNVGVLSIASAGGRGPKAVINQKICRCIVLHRRIPGASVSAEAPTKDYNISIVANSLGPSQNTSIMVIKGY
jgi:hypothetical protein